MTVLIVLSSLIQDCELERLWDDFCEAVAYEQRTGFVTRVVCKGFDKNNLPIYEKIPPDDRNIAL